MIWSKKAKFTNVSEKFTDEWFLFAKIFSFAFVVSKP